jgi:dipeptidyl aminopeptidase/acylaminoacyl peptidase
MNVNNGKLKYMDVIPHTRGKAKIIGVGVDTDENVRIAFERHTGENKYDPDDDILTFHYKSEGGWSKLRIPEARSNATYDALGFSKDNKKFYFTSNYDMPKNDTSGVFSFNFETKLLKLEFRHPDVDIAGAIRGPDNEILGVVYSPGYPAKHYFDKDNKEVKFLESLSASFKGQYVTVTSYTNDGSKAIVRVRSDRNPGNFYLYDRSTGNLRYLASRYSKIDPKKMATVEAFTMAARDGVKLYGLLTIPNGSDGKNLPLIVNPHGGPRSHDQWGYNWRNQILANRGYAVLQIDFRGSDGYGEDFIDLGNRQWGRTMQDDITDATLWAIKEGIADKDRICIMGGSYGGYATLQGLVREPDLYKCGIGVVGVYSLPMMWTKGDVVEASRFNYSEIYLNEIIGREDAELKAFSPAYNVDKIKAGVFIVHGSRDERVPIEHAELLRDNFDKIGKKYEWMVRDEGHGFTQEKNKIEQYNKVLVFLNKYIGK